MRDVHVIYTDPADHGYGWSIESPQLPGLSAGRATVEEALADTPRILRFTGLDPGTYRLHQHEQKYVTDPDGNEFLIRFVGVTEDDPHEGARGEVVGRELFSIQSGAMSADLNQLPTTSMGERLIIAAHPSDRVGWILDQLFPSDGAVVAYYGGEDAIYSLPVFPDDGDWGGGSALEKLGITSDSPVAELFDAVMAHEAASLRRVAVEHLTPA